MDDLFIIGPGSQAMYWIDDFFFSFLRQEAAQNGEMS